MHMQVEDQSSSDGEGSTSSDKEDISHLRSIDPTSLANKNVGTRGAFENQQYTKLNHNTIDDPNIYEIPSDNEHSIGSRVASGSYHRASPEPQDHKTEYIKMPHTTSSSSLLSSKRSPSWVRQTFHRTFHRRYMDMKMVSMDGCSHEGAKKFFTFAGLITFILLTALVGVVIGTSSWVVMRERANMIEGELDNYTTSLRYCRVGRNWTSLKINRKSKAFDHPIPVNSSHVLDVSLNNLTQTTLSKDLTDLYASQLLLYVVLRSFATTSDNNSDDFAMMELPSYINVALWTQTPSKTTNKIQFRQYMAILNDLPTPQIVSRSFWFPLLETDNHFYVSAELIDSDPDEATPTPLDLNFRLYLAGYC